MSKGEGWNIIAFILSAGMINSRDRCVSQKVNAPPVIWRPFDIYSVAPRADADPPGDIKFTDNTPISPKTRFMSPHAKLTSGRIIRGRLPATTWLICRCVYACTYIVYIYIHMYTYPSRLYVIIQLNGQRHIAHTVRDRRTVFAGGTQTRSPSHLLSLSLFVASRE